MMKQGDLTPRASRRQASGSIPDPARANDRFGRLQAILRQGDAKLRAFLSSLNDEEKVQLAAQLTLEKMIADGRLVVVSGERPFGILAAGKTGEPPS